MLEKLNKFFIETMGLTADYWLYILLGIVALAFFVTLIAGLAGGDFVKIKKLMNTVVKNPATAVASMKKMPVSVKNQYRRARVMGVKPSDLVTENDCVTVPYARSLASKIWLVTLVATVLCAAIGFFVCYAMEYSSMSGIMSFVEGETEAGTPPETVLPVMYSASSLVALTVLIAGGILTFIGAMVGVGVKSGALKTYAKFSHAIDGDAPAARAETAQQVMNDGAQAANSMQYAQAEPQYAQAEEPQTVYADAPVYEEPQAAYVEPEQTVEPVVATEPQESEEEIRQRAREEALAQARAQQAAQQAAMQQQAQAQAAAQAAAAQARAQQQAQAQTAQQQAAPSSADDVIAQIEKINREGAPRETMREVATLLQKERAKPENKTPEQQRKLNEALSKLLKAMAASKK